MKDRDLEQQLADKLGSRSIAPTDQAWERISRNRQQGIQNHKKKKKTVVYYAAAIILIMFFSGYFFMVNNNDTIIVEPEVVQSENAKGAVEKPSLNVPDIVTGSKQIEVAETYKSTGEKPVLENTTKETQNVVLAEYEKLQINEKPITASTLQDVQVVTQDKLYEEEVDYLLKNAVKDIAADKQFKNRTNDAALLKEVEGEMNEYYREKAMSIFSLKNKKIRIAVKD